MLTADLVEARPRADELRLTPLDHKRRPAAIALAAQVLDTHRALIGQTREALALALAELPVAARERRLFAGLSKLVDDHATFEGGEALATPPDELRHALFLDAAAARRGAPPCSRRTRRATAPHRTTSSARCTPTSAAPSCCGRWRPRPPRPWWTAGPTPRCRRCCCAR